MKKAKRRIDVKIRNTQKKITIDKRRIAALARRILEIKGVGQAELSVLFVGQRRMRALNRNFRNIDRPTDVLAFGMRAGKNSCCRLTPATYAAVRRSRTGKVQPEILGDVVICPSMALQSAKIYQSSLRQEIILYLLHGILHILGSDDLHLHNRRLMEKEQAEILNSLKDC